MWAWLKSAVRSRYDVMPGQENARLRRENRAFLNSLLGVAGFAPVKLPEAGKPVDLSRFRSDPGIRCKRSKREKPREMVSGYQRAQRPAATPQELSRRTDLLDNRDDARIVFD